MRKKSKEYLIGSAVLFLAFAAFTALVSRFDVKPIGPEGSEVGFAALNQFVFRLFGVNLIWYDITDCLGIIPVLFALGFGLTGLWQLIKGKSIRKVDSSILLLGLFYLLVIGAYLFFEQVVMNYRPVILEEGLEASYPSSHTMLVVCVMAAAATQFRILCPDKKRLCRGMDVLSCVLIGVTVVGRLISGVHWFTDIVGGLLLSFALVTLYWAGIAYRQESV